MPGTAAWILVPLLVGCIGDDGTGITPDACEGALTDGRVNVPLECDDLGYLVREAGRLEGTEIILAPGIYEIEGDLVLKNDVLFRGEDPGDPPILVPTGEISALNATLEDLIIDGVLDAKQTELRRITATRIDLEDVSAMQLHTETLQGIAEFELNDVDFSDKIELEGWGRLTRVVGSSGMVTLTGDTTVAASRLPDLVVRPDSDERDRVDVVIRDTRILGGLTTYGGTAGTVYVQVEDSEMAALAIDSNTRSAGVELSLLRSLVVGGQPVIIDLDGADNYVLEIKNSLVHGPSNLLSTQSDGLGLAEAAEIEMSNNVLVGGNFVFQQDPACGVYSTTELSLQNNVFVGVTFAVQLLLDQDWLTSHNLFMDSTCVSCVQVITDGCSSESETQELPFIEAEGSFLDDADFVDLNQDEPGSSDLRLNAGSPAIDAGVPEWLDPDGSRSDIGMYGGPNASE